MTAPSVGVALRYMRHFHCIGSACEDNCCSHPWNVPVGQDDYERLRNAMSGSADERAGFERGCAVTKDPGVDDASYATLQRTPDGNCVFLGSERLCTIHARYGPAPLPTTCATYPRIVWRLDDRVELAGTLSCPETARLCLLAEHAVEQVPFDTGELPSACLSHPLPASSGAHNGRWFLSVRAAVLQLLTARDYPLQSRLYFAAHLTDRLAAVLEDGDEAHVRREIADGTAVGTLDALHRRFGAAEVPPAVAFALVQQLLIAVMHLSFPTRFKQLLAEIYAPYLEEEPAPHGAAPSHSVIGGRAWDDYRVRRGHWEALLGARIDQYFANYAANYWYKEPYTAAPDPLAHMVRLLVRIDLLRFLLFSHPRLETLRQNGAGGPELRELVGGVAVEVFYTFSRAVEHSPPFLKELQRVLDEFGMCTLSQATLLLKF